MVKLHATDEQLFIFEEKQLPSQKTEVITCPDDRAAGD
jgi:hypothetical protein